MAFLKETLKIDHVAMALDSGFLINELCIPPARKNVSFRVVIIPRRNYFYTYSMQSIYPKYLKAIVGFIEWAQKEFDCEIILTSQTKDRDAIVDVISELRREDSSCMKCLKVVIPENIAEAYSLYGSSDFVLTSYMHGGINALAAGVPALFVMPFSDTKVLETLEFLGLDTDNFVVDLFNRESMNRSTLIEKTQNILHENNKFKSLIKSLVDKRTPTLKEPVKTLSKLL